MKALTISQPFASLIADGEKWIENRTWSTNYRGPIAIHAGKGSQYLNKAELAEFPTGVVLAVAELTACVEISQIKWNARSDWSNTIRGTSRTWLDALNHEHAEGPWCWILDNVTKLELPISASGKQGIWDWDES